MLYLPFSTSQGGKMSGGKAALAAVGAIGSMVDVDERDRKIK
jgi:hypothetical protein